MAEELQYAYAVARIRALENKLLDKGKFDRMIEAVTAEEALKVLQEAGYADTVGETAGPWNYEAMLKEEMKLTVELLKKILPETDAINILLLKNDYHNIKVLLKSEFTGQEHNEILVDGGTVPSATMYGIIKERNYKGLHDIMKQAIISAIDMFSRTRDPQYIDIIMDQACFNHMTEYAGQIKSNFVADFIKAQVDISNIKAFIRIKAQNRSADFLKKVLLQGGSISTALFVEKLEAGLDSFVEVLKYTRYGAAYEEGIAGFNGSGSLTRLEKLFDDFLMGFIRKARYKSFGLEPLIGFLLARETEIRNARIIMVGKINNIPGEIIRERLRETYV